MPEQVDLGARLLFGSELTALSGERPADEETPIGLFRSLGAATPAFLLESVPGGEGLGRHSLFGTGSLLRLTSHHGQLRLSSGHQVIDAGTDLVGLLRRLMAEMEPLAGAGPGGALPAGLVGYIGYDAVQRFEQVSLKASAETLPEVDLFAPSVIYRYDHRHQMLRATVIGPADNRPALEQQLKRALEVPALPVQRQQPTRPARLIGCAPSRDQYIQAVTRAKEAIHDGEVFQLVLSVKRRLAGVRDPLDAYRRLRRVNPSPYMFLLRLPEATLLGSSPEMLVSVSGRQVVVRPIAGTRPRGRTPALDRALIEELQLDEKERAEHVMLVDLGRNDVGRVSAPGTVRVDPLMTIESYSHVHHMVSQVTGELASGRDAIDALAAAFPAGTLTGAPKVRAMELIDELETESRGAYGGAVGYLAADGNMDLCIAIRMACVQGDQAVVQAGAGLVWDSSPEAEWQECARKAEAVLDALGVEVEA
ncbi:MAG: anthranilate synthase component I family protein [Sulfobacillus sp.]